jgi:hypothetical protein
MLRRTNFGLACKRALELALYLDTGLSAPSRRRGQTEVGERSDLSSGFLYLCSVADTAMFSID